MPTITPVNFPNFFSRFSFVHKQHSFLTAIKQPTRISAVCRKTQTSYENEKKCVRLHMLNYKQIKVLLATADKKFSEKIIWFCFHALIHHNSTLSFAFACSSLLQVYRPKHRNCIQTFILFVFGEQVFFFEGKIIAVCAIFIQ